MRQTALLSLCLFLALPAFAHDKDHEEGPPGKGHEEGGIPEFAPKTMLDHLERELMLDAKQRDKVKAILDDGDAAVKSKREEMEALAKKMETLHKEMSGHQRQVEEKVRETLTLEQKERFDEMRMRGRRGAPGFHPPGGERVPGGREGGQERMPPGFPRGGPGGGTRGEQDPANFPTEMWHEHAPPGAPPKGRDPRMNPRPDDQPPGAPPEPEDGD